MLYFWVKAFFKKAALVVEELFLATQPTLIILIFFVDYRWKMLFSCSFKDNLFEYYWVWKFPLRCIGPLAFFSELHVKTLLHIIFNGAFIFLLNIVYRRNLHSEAITINTINIFLFVNCHLIG